MSVFEIDQPAVLLTQTAQGGQVVDFLQQIDAQVPRDLDIHIIMDNHAAHKTALARAWLARRPHDHAHFTPTSASLITQIQRRCTELT